MSAEHEKSNEPDSALTQMQRSAVSGKNRRGSPPACLRAGASEKPVDAEAGAVLIPETFRYANPEHFKRVAYSSAMVAGSMGHIRSFPTPRRNREFAPFEDLNEDILVVFGTCTSFAALIARSRRIFRSLLSYQ